MNLVCESFVLCERVIEDRQTGALTLVSCLEDIGALTFPSLHHGFACAARYRCDGEVPDGPVRVKYRFVRASEQEPEEIVSELDGEWAPNTRYARIWVNFQVLRLKRAEPLRFRVDHQAGDGPWIPGHEYSVAVSKITLTPEQREALGGQLKSLGLPMPPTEAD